MKITGGAYRGKPLISPKGGRTRPTSSRAREAIFNILAHGIEGFDLKDKRVLDLFAGTGALGLEALSRGGRFCLFVEQDASARAAIRQNIEALELMGITKVFRRNATKLGPVRPLRPFDLVFADPPYGKGLGKQGLKALIEGEWLNAHAVIVLEERANIEVKPGNDFEILDQRAHGDTQTLILRSTTAK